MNASGDSNVRDQAGAHSLRQTIRADIEAVRHHRDGRLYPFLFPNLFAVAVFRVAHAIGQRGFAGVAHAMCIGITVLTGLEVGWRAEIGPGLFIHHTVGVILPGEMRAGRNLSVGAAVVVGGAIGTGANTDRLGFPSLGDDVQIMARASVIGPIEIGSRAVVAAHALVINDVPPGATARGLPARNYVDGEIVS